MTTKQAFNNLKSEVAVFHGAIRRVFSKKKSAKPPKEMGLKTTVTVTFVDSEIPQKLRNAIPIDYDVKEVRSVSVEDIID